MGAGRMAELLKQDVGLHPAQRCYQAEDLVRLRRSDEQRRYVAPQRAGRIDPNPHQIEAVIFALKRIPDGGCILADEVGLGKTIEAGLVIRQLLAEGATRILLIAPKPLLGQWRQELFTLFDIEAHEGEPKAGAFDGPGVFLIGREAAGSERGSAALLGSDAFDLCVIDEAHEYFGGLYQRFDAEGEYRDDSPKAQTADRVRSVLRAGRVPVLLLTATPMQNSLDELWSLVHYVDLNGTLLGDLPTFRALFSGEEKRQLARGQEEELRGRLKTVLQRTLRRQAQEFLDKPFVDRHARKFEYDMSPEERSLYDDVTRYLLEPGIVAFRGSSRQLLLTLFHRQMASSTRALASSLKKVAERLRKTLKAVSGEPGAIAEDESEWLRDLEEDLPAKEVAAEDELPAVNPARVRAEAERVEAFVQRAHELEGADSKFEQLRKALQLVAARANSGDGSGKVVIFTESIQTQEYLRDRLLASGSVFDDDVTLFRGENNSPRAQAALERWRTEIPQDEGVKPSPGVAVRLALVHEFRTRSRVFISTEAGAKGLNLQFCETVVNYDLPWNPQRIEQRIGRCHRYGQKHAVTVINFLARDNEAQQLTFEILDEKLNLFGSILDASDEVIHRPENLSSEVLAGALGADIETALRRIWERARTLEEVHAELRALRERVDEQRRRFEETFLRTHGIIEERFDEGLQQVFRRRKEELPGALRELDSDLRRVVLGYLSASGIAYKLEKTVGEGTLLHVSSSPLLPEGAREGITAAIGHVDDHLSLHLGHPLVMAAVQEARGAVRAQASVKVKLPTDAPEVLAAHKGGRGRLRLLKVRYDGFERVERLVPVMVFADESNPQPVEDASWLLRAVLKEAPRPQAPAVADEVIADASEEVLFALRPAIDEAERLRFERASRQIEQFIEDRLLVLKRRREEALTALAAKRLQLEGAVGSERRSETERAVESAETGLEKIEGMIQLLERGEDSTFRRSQEHLLRRRYAVPQVEVLFDLEVALQ
jgi:adenine-specific DNA-methyltransferase